MNERICAVSVIVSGLNGVEQIATFNDNTDGWREAETYFKKIVKKIVGLDENDIEQCLVSGGYNGNDKDDDEISISINNSTLLA